MFRIGDFSRLSFVTVKTIRYYDEIGLLKPERVDRFTGYRYYSVKQLARLNYIMALKEMGLALDEIRLVIDDNLSPAQVRELFLLKQAELRRRVGEEQRRLEQVEKWLLQLERGETMSDYQFSIKKLDEIKIVSVRGTVPAYGDIGILIEKLYPALQSGMQYVNGPFTAIYHDMEHMEKNVDIEAALPVSADFPVTPPLTIRTLPAAEAVVTIHYGSYDDIHNAYQALMAWCEANGYELDGPDREIYLVGPDKTQNPAEYVTELQQPVRKTKE